MLGSLGLPRRQSFDQVVQALQCGLFPGRLLGRPHSSTDTQTAKQGRPTLCPRTKLRGLSTQILTLGF